MKTSTKIISIIIIFIFGSIVTSLMRQATGSGILPLIIIAVLTSVILFTKKDNFDKNNKDE